MLKKIIILIVIAVALLGGGVFLFFVSRPADTKSDKSGLDAVLAPADNESRVKYTDSPVELTYWRTWNEASAMTPAIDAFTKLHPNIKITIRDIDYGSYDDELAQAAKTGNLPDIYSVLNDWVPRYEPYSTPAPDTVYTEKVYRDTFVDAVTERLVTNGKIKGVSYGVSTLGLFYNNELLNNAGVQPPTTWEEFVTASRKLTAKSGNTITQSGAALGTPFVHQAVDIQAVLMLQNGAQMTDSPPTKATFAQPDGANVNAGAKAFDFYMSFARPDKQNYSFNDTLGYSVKAFAEGKVAMMINYPFKSLEVNQFNSSLNYTMTKLPQIKGEKEINFGQFWVEMVNKNSQKAEIAWDFMRFAATRDIQVKFGQATLRPTSRKDLIKDQSGDKKLGAFASQTASAKTFYRGNDKEMNGFFYNALVSVLSGVDPQLALKNAETRATELIKRYPAQ